jgi:hypothetical protein
MLTNEDMKEIEGAAPFDIGFPLKMLGKGCRELVADSHWVTLSICPNPSARSKAKPPRHASGISELSRLEGGASLILCSYQSLPS